MPRVTTRTKNRGGRDRHCGRCGEVIKPGEKYYTWAFRYGGSRFNCYRHHPRQSELTQSKMSGVYAAIESAQDAIAAAETVERL